MVTAGRCAKHVREAGRMRRQFDGPRPYDRRAWRDRIRPAQLAREPLCRFCIEGGRVNAAVDVDHIDGDASNNAAANLRSLCRSCHSRRTMRDQVRGAR